MQSKIKYRLMGIKNAITLLGTGEWREFVLRLRIALGQIDLKNDASETVTDRTHYYVDSSGLAFDRIMAHFHITPDDAIVDFGCGKGGALISLAKHPFRKITGVEIAPEIVETAKANINKLQIKNVEIECCDVSDFKQLGEYNYFYFFNPFPCTVMREVLVNIEQSLVDLPRKVTVIYLHPFCYELFDSSNIFRKTEELPHFEYKCFIYSNV